MNIEELIPHRPPMLLIDQLIEWDLDHKKLEAVKTVNPDEFFLQGHYPDFPIVPGVITCEMIFQAGAALMSLLIKDGRIEASLSEGMVPVVTRSNNTKFKGIIRPKDEVKLSVSLVEQISSAFYLKGQAKVNGKNCASVEFTCMLAKLDK